MLYDFNKRSGEYAVALLFFRMLRHRRNAKTTKNINTYNKKLI